MNVYSTNPVDPLRSDYTSHILVLFMKLLIRYGVTLSLIAGSAHAQQFSVVEASITDMRHALEQKRVTSRELVRQSLERIGTYEDQLHAAITVNPRALAIADS